MIQVNVVIKTDFKNFIHTSHLIVKIQRTSKYGKKDQIFKM